MPSFLKKPPELRSLLHFLFCLFQLVKLSRYFTPLAVLKSTTRSCGFTDPFCINFLSAGKQAAPSGAQKIPSAAPISLVAAINSRSEEHTSELQSRRDLVC